MYSVSKILNKINKYEVESNITVKDNTVYKTVYIPHNKNYVIKVDKEDVCSCDEEVRLYNKSKSYKLSNLFLPITNINKVILPIKYLNYMSIKENKDIEVKFLKYRNSTEFYLQEKIEEYNSISDTESDISALINYLRERYSYVTDLENMLFSYYLIIKLIELYEPNGKGDIEEFCILNEIDVEDILYREEFMREDREKYSSEEVVEESSSSSSSSKEINTNSSISMSDIISFIMENNIEDVHSENWGWLRGKPVIFDYSGFSGESREETSTR